MFKYCLLFLSFLIFTGGCANEETPHTPIETFDHATVIGGKGCQNARGEGCELPFARQNCISRLARRDKHCLFGQTPKH